MGIRTGKEPSVNDSFLWRICHALDETPRMLAKNVGVEYEDIHPLLEGASASLIEIDRSDTWFKISEYVARKTGLLMAVRSELDRKLQSDRAKRASRLERFKGYHE